jgi:hypothetical protein
MKREQLEALELSKENIDAIMKLHGEDVNSLKAAHDKALEAAGGDAAEVQKQLEAANKQIEELSNLDAEGSKKAAEEWKAKATQFEADLAEAQKAREQEVAAIRFDHALEAALVGAKARDPKDILPHLDRDVLKLDEDGTVKGLSEQLKSLQDNKAYLFDTGKPERKIVDGANNTSLKGDAMVNAAFEAAGVKPPEG